jgi:hypothetical protein
MNPDIQRYFEYSYDEGGNLHITILAPFVKELKWDSSDLEISFGGIRRMNDWGSDPTITIHAKKQYVHPWEKYHAQQQSNPD